MQYLLVGIGGALGSLVRYNLGKIISSKFKNIFPVSIFIINITGAMLLGLVSSIGVKNNLSLLLADGFLGAYTTFSTFMYEGFNLMKDNKRVNAYMYILGSLVLGVIGFEMGNLIGTVIK